LLVSVRNAAEAASAVRGGADIVDAKEPAGGAIAPVSGIELLAIAAAVPGRVRLSAALGDVASSADVRRAFDALAVPLSFVKLGFRGVHDPLRVQGLLAEAVKRATALPKRPAVIAVAYADHRRAASLAPAAFAGLVSEAGAEGVLVDTCCKDGGTLFDFLAAPELAAMGAALQGEGLLFALGGSLGAEQARAASQAGAAVLGVRGAVCRGGREGRVDEALVRQLALAVRAAEPRRVATR
jgi:uncharacterized protein (UPF0264 family)